MMYQAEQNTLTIFIEAESEKQAKTILKETYGGEWVVFPAHERDMVELRLCLCRKTIHMGVEH